MNLLWSANAWAVKVTGCSCVPCEMYWKTYKNLWYMYEEREQLDSGGGGALSGHDEKLFICLIA